MASERVPQNPPTDSQLVFETASLRLMQAVALIRMMGIALEYSPSDGLPVEDASCGVVYLLEVAGGLFQGSSSGVAVG
jgi:hypothetical protein